MTLQSPGMSALPRGPDSSLDPVSSRTISRHKNERDEVKQSLAAVHFTDKCRASPSEKEGARGHRRS